MSLFVTNLCEEIELRAHKLSGKYDINTLFFGGGTPSLLSSSQMELIIEKLNNHFDIDAEITVECNPGTISYDKLMNYRTLGINRLSFGVQSFVEAELIFLQRIHSVQQITNAVDTARKAGFDNINLDLMFSVPGQTKDSISYSIDKALELSPEHISAYSLIYEENTPLYNDYLSGKIKKYSDDKDAEFYAFVIDRLSSAGFVHYEVSNFACNEQHKCRHNLIYWSGNEYIAFGPSAQGYLNNVRYKNYSVLSKYNEMISDMKLPVEEYEELDRDKKLLEHIMLGLRAEGINLQSLIKDFQINFLDLFAEEIADWQLNDLINLTDSKLSMTSKGYAVCDEIILKIISKF